MLVKAKEKQISFLFQEHDPFLRLDAESWSKSISAKCCPTQE